MYGCPSMIHKQSVWLTLSVLLVAVLVLAWLANNRPPCLEEAATTASGGRCIHVRN
jgi:hypothetical protein